MPRLVHSAAPAVLAAPNSCTRRSFLGLTAALLLGVASVNVFSPRARAAEVYPQRPIRFIVPNAPGGTSDLIGRILGAKLGNALGQQVVVDNRPGGSQVIGTELTARAAPDGYTVLVAGLVHTTNPALVKQLPYDSIKDFAPITLIMKSPLIFVAHPSLKVGNMGELIAQAKARPDRINYGSGGSGTGGHLSVELLKWTTGIKMVHVPYKGAGPALADLIGGQVQVVCTSLLAALPHVRSGKLTALAITSGSRSRAAPEIPAVAESVPGYETPDWYALLAPAATSQAIITRLHAEIAAILKLPDVTERLLAQGADPVGNSPQEFGEFLQTEIDRWTKVIREANITVN